MENLSHSVHLSVHQLLDNLVPDIFSLAKGGYVTHKRNQRTVSKHKLIDIHREAKKWDEICIKTDGTVEPHSGEGLPILWGQRLKIKRKI